MFKKQMIILLLLASNASYCSDKPIELFEEPSFNLLLPFPDPWREDEEMQGTQEPLQKALKPLQEELANIQKKLQEVEQVVMFSQPPVVTPASTIILEGIDEKCNKLNQDQIVILDELKELNRCILSEKSTCEQSKKRERDHSLEILLQASPCKRQKFEDSFKNDMGRAFRDLTQWCTTVANEDTLAPNSMPEFQRELAYCQSLLNSYAFLELARQILQHVKLRDIKTHDRLGLINTLYQKLYEKKDEF